MMNSGRKILPLSYVSGPEIPMLHVGGYYDQEDINGPQLMYSIWKKGIPNRNFIVWGPGIMVNGEDGGRQPWQNIFRQQYC